MATARPWRMRSAATCAIARSRSRATPSTSFVARADLMMPASLRPPFCANKELLGSARLLSSATVTPTTGSDSSENADDKSKNKSKKDNPNIFLDNLGKIFLSTIGAVLLMLLRSTKSNNSRTALREDVESTSILDPLEIDDLRVANSDFTVDVWEQIVQRIKSEFIDRGRRSVSYAEFLSLVMHCMKEMKGEGFTIQLGHLLDRVVIAEVERLADADADDSNVASTNAFERELPLSFLLATLSLALHSSVADRVRLLFEAIRHVDEAVVDEAVVDGGESQASGEQVAEMIRNLQKTCQLTPDAQIVETDCKVPYQTYRVGTGDEDLTRRARGGYGGKKGSHGVTSSAEGPLTQDDFHAILNSRTVCAWGECFIKKSGRTSTSDV